MPKGPNLKGYLEKTVMLNLNKNRKVSGILRGYDQFMNLVLEDAEEQARDGSKTDIGSIVIRGNCILQVELIGK
tara:strand:+ start:281 stop:502 length:222 start_codon:yes stop_codon:yes gene_type:complete